MESPSGFSFYVPPDAKATAAQGIDSEVREFVAPSWRLVVDYGPFGASHGPPARALGVSILPQPVRR